MRIYAEPSSEGTALSVGRMKYAVAAEDAAQSNQKRKKPSE
jgi:hypothetical protein